MRQAMAAAWASVPLEPTPNDAVVQLLQLTSKYNQIVIWQASRPLAQRPNL
jgi:hypothetical protein